MDEATFWAVVEETRRIGDGDLERQTEALLDALTQRTVDDLVAFQERFDDLHERLYGWALWGAAYVLLDGCSDDGFIDFRTWVISQGPDVYRRATQDPDSLADVVTDPEQTAEAELFGYVAQDVYAERTGSAEMPRREPVAAGAEPAGAPWDEPDLPRLYPRLTALVGGAPEHGSQP